MPGIPSFICMSFWLAWFRTKRQLLRSGPAQNLSCRTRQACDVGYSSSPFLFGSHYFSSLFKFCLDDLRSEPSREGTSTLRHTIYTPNPLEQSNFRTPNSCQNSSLQMRRCLTGTISIINRVPPWIDSNAIPPQSRSTGTAALQPDPEFRKARRLSQGKSYSIREMGVLRMGPLKWSVSFWFPFTSRYRPFEKPPSVCHGLFAPQKAKIPWQCFSSIE